MPEKEGQNSYISDPAAAAPPSDGMDASLPLIIIVFLLMGWFMRP
jgi:hypothetical protein